MRDCGGSVRRQRSTLALLALLACALSSPTMAEESADPRCPQECQCEADATIRCSGVAGLRTLDKSQPIARLVLSGLALTKIPAPLENLRNVTELDLSGNRLAEVSHLGKRVRKLNLAHNRITSGKLARIPPVVESLNLTHNEITHLPLHLMKLKQLRYIELANNPINCTCETLHVRNWLTSRHVWSDEHIKCMAPAAFKGRPWLQVRQSDVCHPTVAEERKGGYSWDDYEDDNELMLGDQPAAHGVGEAVHDDDRRQDDEEDDFRREYFPVGEKVKRQEPPIADEDEASGGGPALDQEPSIGAEARARVVDSLMAEGSGDVGVARLAHDDSRFAADRSAEAGDGETDEGSGSGGGLLLDLHHFGADEHLEDPAATVPIDEGDDGLEESGETKEEIPLAFPTDLGIFVDGTSPASAADGDAESSTVRLAAEGARVLAGGVMQTAVLLPGEGTPDAPLVEGDPTDGATRGAQAEEDNRNTYILLAVLGVIVVSLIVMVVCKRKDQGRGQGRGAKDAEQGIGGREMKEMKRTLLEKGPAAAAGDRNGGHGVAGGAPEQQPLMAKSDYDKVFGDPQKTAFAPVKPQRASLEQPLESFKPIAAERNGGARHGEPDNNNTAALPNGNGTVHHGSGPLPGVHKPAADATDATDADTDGHHLLAEPPMESPRAKRYSPIYVPTSPKSDRYSPVYSPETGRVKIKLTETPKPKTPILVTRSRSRAGEIITTMDDQKF